MLVIKISNRVKKIILSIFALFLLISPSLILADNNDTVSYLQSQSQNTWISQALAAAQVENLDISYMDYNTDNLMTASKNILVLSALQSDNHSAAKDFVSVIENSKNNGQFGSVDLLNDDFWPIIALGSVAMTAQHQDVKDFILEHQNTDGGWSWSSSGPSDSNDTAAAVMALLELGLSSSSSEIVQAISYLQSLQQEDGGFAYDSTSQSDGASTAWVLAALNKLNIDANTWQKNGLTPILFLESLRQSDGSFLWLPADENSSTIVTAYALLSLSGASYPVNYISLEDNEQQNTVDGHSIRVEGPAGTICLAENLQASNVLALLQVASDVCDFSYQTQDSSFGTYVSSIAGVNAEGLNGWQYFVDYESALVAAGDYVLVDNQDILWAYGGFPFYPTKIEINSNNANIGDSIIISAQYYINNAWQSIDTADIVIASQTYQTDVNGQFIYTAENNGVYPIYIEGSNQYIRSAKEYLIVGDGVSQEVDLSVNIEAGSGNNNPGDTIAFSLDRASIDFGNLKAGQAADSLLQISNTGNVDIYIEASVLGDEVFTDFTKLDQNIWSDYNLNLASQLSSTVNVALDLPLNIDTLGQKSGQLIFWAINQ